MGRRRKVIRVELPPVEVAVCLGVAGEDGITIHPQQKKREVVDTLIHEGLHDAISQYQVQFGSSPLKSDEENFVRFVEPIISGLLYRHFTLTYKKKFAKELREGRLIEKQRLAK